MGKVAIRIDNATIYQALLTQKSPKNDHICVQRWTLKRLMQWQDTRGWHKCLWRYKTTLSKLTKGDMTTTRFTHTKI